jgi:hypothetical protein
MVIHELKTWPDFFNAAKDGLKTFEYRKNDRNFQVGDLLHLREYDPGFNTYTGRSVLFEVSYIFKDFPGLPPDYCVMAIRFR